MEATVVAVAAVVAAAVAEEAVAAATAAGTAGSRGILCDLESRRGNSLAALSFGRRKEKGSFALRDTETPSHGAGRRGSAELPGRRRVFKAAGTGMV